MLGLEYLTASEKHCENYRFRLSVASGRSGLAEHDIGGRAWPDAWSSPTCAYARPELASKK